MKTILGIVLAAILSLFAIAAPANAADLDYVVPAPTVVGGFCATTQADIIYPNITDNNGSGYPVVDWRTTVNAGQTAYLITATVRDDQRGHALLQYVEGGQLYDVLNFKVPKCDPQIVIIAPAPTLVKSTVCGRDHRVVINQVRPDVLIYSRTTLNGTMTVKATVDPKLVKIYDIAYNSSVLAGDVATWTFKVSNPCPR